MENTKTKKIKKQKSKVNSITIMYKKLWISILSTLIMISMFTGSTLAWFNSNALASGNYVKTGVMAIDLLMSENDLNANIEHYNYTRKEFEPEKNIEDYHEYIRRIDITDDGNDNPENFYVITDTDTAVLHLDNAEPGQCFSFKYKVANVGQLALTYMPSIDIEVDEEGNSLSLTGLQKLEKEKAEADFAHDDSRGGSIETGDYSFDEVLSALGLLTQRDYEIRKRVLEREQIDHDETSETYGQDIGGHLEDVIKVYYGTTKEDTENEENYIGTLKEIVNKEIKKYNGYLLPYYEVEGYLSGGGRTVEIVDDDEVIEVKEKVTEFGEMNIIFVLPEDVGNEYQYSSLTLRVGATATQVEYEEDGLGITIYDKNARLISED